MHGDQSVQRLTKAVQSSDVVKTSPEPDNESSIHNQALVCLSVSLSVCLSFCLLSSRDMNEYLIYFLRLQELRVQKHFAKDGGLITASHRHTFAFRLNIKRSNV